ncbi:hypothetical protein [Psychromonas aquatilis]|uniref:Uncharacterized protein n=1 Tax=Psychromonas aquatilis TaxID=2005072 RepID=A0ABU9GNI0_9GAMM
MKRSRTSIDAIFNQIENKEIGSFTVNSLGGNVHAAMDLADWIKENNISLIVEGNCFSSCANYFIPGASSVLIKSRSIAGLHGGALQKIWRRNYPWYLYVFPLMIIIDQ